MTKTLFLLLSLAGQVFAQGYPQISTPGPTRPSMQVGGALSNIGNVTVYTGGGAPGTITTSTVGDIYVDTANKVFYMCAASSPCTLWVYSSPPASVSVASFGVNGNPSTDPANFQTAVNTMAGHGCLSIPQNFSVDLSTATASIVPPTANVCIQGNGDTSIIKGSSSLSSLNSVIAFPPNTSNAFLSNFQINGACTGTPGGVLYSDAISHGVSWSTLATGSSLSFSGASSGITIDGITINHTCGYAMLFDNSAGDVRSIRIRNSKNINSRPFTFGTNPSYLVYGSWGGGILFTGPGTTYMYSDVVVQNCTFQNVIGNALWMHPNTLTVKNQNFSFINNTCIDTGLDCIQVSNLNGYIETGNKSIRNGYVITSDVGSSRVGGPMWLQGYSPVSFDTYATVSSAYRSGNLAESQNGEGIDGDGITNSVIDGNTVVSCFNSTDPLAQSASCGPYYTPSTAVTPGANNYVRGMSFNNSANTGTVNLMTITNNNLIGVGGGGIVAFGIQNSVIANNTIDMPGVSYSNPIVLGNRGNGTAQVAKNNVVTKNYTTWFPPTSQPMVFEDTTTVHFSGVVNTASTLVTWVSGDQFVPSMQTQTIVISSTPYSILSYNSPTSLTLSASAGVLSSAAYSITAAYQTTDANTITGNRWLANNPYVYEFAKAANNSTSTGSSTLSSVSAGAPSGSIFSSVLQTEGTVTPTFNVYSNILGVGTRAFTASPQGLVPPIVHFSQLPLISGPAQVVFCDDCTTNTRPCTSGGTGALAFTNASQWNCGY